MAQGSVHERLDRLENLMDDVLHQLSADKKREKDWRRTVGMFDGDPIAKEIIDGALRAREEDRVKFYEDFDKQNNAS